MLIHFYRLQLTCVLAFWRALLVPRAELPNAEVLPFTPRRGRI